MPALVNSSQARTTNAWLAKDPVDRPIINLVTLKYSPVVAAVDQYCSMLTDDPKTSFVLLDGQALN